MSEPSWPDEIAQGGITMPAAARAIATRTGDEREDPLDDSAWQSAVVRMGTLLALWLGY